LSTCAYIAANTFYLLFSTLSLSPFLPLTVCVGNAQLSKAENDLAMSEQADLGLTNGPSDLTQS
jgi:hypothetical protein